MSVKQTKTILLGVIVLLSFLVVFQACEKSGTKGLSSTITLKEKETKTIAYQGKSISIVATDFKDSRCPINADCVWQGNATVKIKFKDDVKEQDLLLCLGSCAILSTPLPETVTLNGTTYKIKLKEITPYPILNNPNVAGWEAKITLSE